MVIFFVVIQINSFSFYCVADTVNRLDVLFGVYEKGSDLEKGFHVLENILDLGFIPVSADDALGPDFQTASLALAVIGDKNAQAIKQFFCGNHRILFLDFNPETLDIFDGPVFQLFWNGDRVQHRQLEVFFDLETF